MWTLKKRMLHVSIEISCCSMINYLARTVVFSFSRGDQIEEDNKLQIIIKSGVMEMVIANSEISVELCSLWIGTLIMSIIWKTPAPPPSLSLSLALYLSFSPEPSLAATVLWFRNLPSNTHRHTLTHSHGRTYAHHFHIKIRYHYYTIVTFVFDNKAVHILYTTVTSLTVV